MDKLNRLREKCEAEGWVFKRRFQADKYLYADIIGGESETVKCAVGEFFPDAYLTKRQRGKLTFRLNPGLENVVATPPAPRLRWALRDGDRVLQYRWGAGWRDVPTMEAPDA